MVDPEMDSFICPFCATSNASSEKTEITHFLSLKGLINTVFIEEGELRPRYRRDLIPRPENEEGELGWDPEALALTIRRCGKCKKYSLRIISLGEALDFEEIVVWPWHDSAIQFPEYVPKYIREDYEEACSIVNLSPKASAALSRRCLQAMLRDFWGLNEPNLYSEIKALEDKPEISALDQEVLNAIRKLGNIASHPEKDPSLIVEIEPKEAQQMVKMLEVLIQSWYVERHNKEELKKNLVAIAASKRHQ